MEHENAIPRICFRVLTPWPMTLSDAHDLYNRKIPDARYMKRMRIQSKSRNPLMNFIIRKTNSSSVTAEAREAADQRRKDYVSDDEYCEPCNKHVIFNAREASCVCTACGNSRNHQQPDTGFREGTSLHVPYLYKQSNHFRDHLKRIQGKESTDIPEHVMEAIFAELDKRGDDRSNVTPEEIRLILKHLDRSKLYNHTIRIWSLATGKKPPCMTSHQEHELLHMFQMIQGPWSKTRPKNRSNMLSYTYLLNKMCNLLGYTDLAQSFKLLKSRDKLVQQDMFWKRICKELDFDFDRSVR